MAGAWIETSQLEAEVEQLTFDLDDARSEVDDVTANVEAICNEFFAYTGALEDIYYAAC